jgi:hypothetical protein
MRGAAPVPAPLVDWNPAGQEDEGFRSTDRALTFFVDFLAVQTQARGSKLHSI